MLSIKNEDYRMVTVSFYMKESLKIINLIENKKFMPIEKLYMNENSKIEKLNEKVNHLTMIKLCMNEIFWNGSMIEYESYIEMMVVLYMSENLKNENQYEKHKSIWYYMIWMDIKFMSEYLLIQSVK